MIPETFIPKSVHLKFYWQVFWLAFSNCSLPIRQLTESGIFAIKLLWLTAAGTAPDLNRIPFNAFASPIAAKGRKTFKSNSKNEY